MCAKFDNYFYTRARLTQPQGEFISATFPGSHTPPTNYQQRSYAGVYTHRCTWTNGSSHHNVVFRGSNEAYRFRPNQYDANGNILHNWDPNLAGSHLLHGGLTMPGAGGPTTRRFLHLSYMHTSTSIEKARMFAAWGGVPERTRFLYIIHLETAAAGGGGAQALPYLSYDESPMKSHFGIGEDEILFPRNCVLQIDTSLIPRNQQEANAIYGQCQVRPYTQVPQGPGAPLPQYSAPFHQIRKNNDNHGWAWAIHCRLLPPHNHIYNLDHHIVKKQIAEKFVFDVGENPRIGILLGPGGNTQAPQLLRMHSLRKKIIDWFQANKTRFINPYTGNLFHANSKIIHSSDQQLMAQYGLVADGFYHFGSPQGQPRAILGGKRKKKKKTKKKNRKNKNKISKKKR